MKLQEWSSVFRFRTFHHLFESLTSRITKCLTEVVVAKLTKAEKKWSKSELEDCLIKQNLLSCKSEKQLLNCFHHRRSSLVSLDAFIAEVLLPVYVTKNTKEP